MTVTHNKMYTFCEFFNFVKTWMMQGQGRKYNQIDAWIVIFRSSKDIYNTWPVYPRLFDTKRHSIPGIVQKCFVFYYQVFLSFLNVSCVGSREFLSA